ncbi:hypothetical protein [Pseudanabaena sp. lw0831]|uniref:hypothetical protein n=1 Tax=Pseudanabaena sp. lw0831 TaxID=1357935 RepID=UPI0019150BA9|nr:hypothetical protein [Pseudanabaena sp. lw0831]
MAGFQKTDFGVSSAKGAGNSKIGFIMRIAECSRTFDNIKIKPKKKKHRNYCDASSLAL